MFDFGREYPAYEYGADNDSIGRIHNAEPSQETAKGVFLAGSADNISVIDFVRREHRSCCLEVATIEYGAAFLCARCGLGVIYPGTTFNLVSHCQLKV